MHRGSAWRIPPSVQIHNRRNRCDATGGGCPESRMATTQEMQAWSFRVGIRLHVAIIVFVCRRMRVVKAAGMDQDRSVEDNLQCTDSLRV
ncbi:hypothetical protein CDEST_14631 [Colletotrichum destructivum]|uniref:Uncharacterized protein n=1 Tax=Colletotrichum destructivum TaxID=34406 RepID=A0AAX4J234_9PEZI|nr:hypothetical protein CDEST_14631 [Colletotrichum destructivum]